MIFKFPLGIKSFHSDNACVRNDYFCLISVLSPICFHYKFMKKLSIYRFNKKTSFFAENESFWVMPVSLDSKAHFLPTVEPL